MKLKTKYQYTYFIYPYLIDKKYYTNYLYRLLKKPKCKLKLFERKKDVEIDTYFLPEIKEKMFWTLDLNKEAIKSYETMDLKMKANVLSKKSCCFFEYSLVEDIPAKMGEDGGIFFDIVKVEIVCFSTGICFLLMKTILNEDSSFSDVLNFNYKFRDIESQTGHSKEYDKIKIQTHKFKNMQTFSEFLKDIVEVNILAKQINLDTNRLITYAYSCLDQDSWNENTDITIIEKEFEKYRHMKSAGEQVDDISRRNGLIYQEKYLYYSFSHNSTVLLTSAINLKNYTNLLYQYENEQLYHYIYHLHQKVYLKKLNYEFSKLKNFNKVKKSFLDFAKHDWIYEVTNDEKGINLEKYYKQAQNADNTFARLKNEYDVLYKEYEIEKVNKYNKWIIAIIILMTIANICFIL